MPIQLSKLKSLQVLRYFVVGKDNKTKIGELRELSDLHGELHLRNLQNVPSGKDALEAKLMDKNNLEALCLNWNGKSNDSTDDKEVLENLLPHTNLKMLYINGYGGTSFPKWLGDVSFCNTVYIRLDKSWEEWCSIEVEDDEVFPELQELEIVGCDSSGSEVLLSSLTRTPAIRHLELGRCEKLEVQELPQTMESISIGGCRGVESLMKALRCLPATLTHLEIHYCEKLEFPMHHDSLKTSLQKYRHGLTCLSFLRIRGCLKFIYFPNGGLHASNLTGLIVNGCKRLKELPEQMANLLPSLEDLRIIDCPEVESFPEGGEGVESFPEEGLLPSTLTHLMMEGFTSLKRLDIKVLQQLTSLTYLEIESCPQLLHLPQQKLPTSLTVLAINKCPILKERCQRDKGKDWNKISHIPGIYLDRKLI
ncbi:putative disease resistance protein At3g14460 [Ziziphus jujuba]|uniref:Disease resistance protein At3g14460 n=1 Tax=Ziziphus jujuba TaxID=326968 RepID=A0ABM3ZYD5_ZIZJJ|nr:putative disease resistance protein At3g14460 [Ziziphus jujuba]